MTTAAKKRLAHDAYNTPPAVADAIVARVYELVGEPLRILEPSCGSGAFVESAVRTWPGSYCLGIDRHQPPGLQGALTTAADFLAWETSALFDLVIGNPPYSLAEAFVRHSLELVATGGVVAFLLRLGFLASAKRTALYHEAPLWYLAPLATRPRFRGDTAGTDASDYGLFIWRRGHTGTGTLGPPIEWDAP